MATPEKTTTLPWSVAFVVTVAIVAVTVSLGLGRDISTLVTFLGLLFIQGGILVRVESVRGDTKEILNGGMEAKVRSVMQEVLDNRDQDWQDNADANRPPDPDKRPGI